jgi:RNA methyltransferase, TrmH family
MAVLKIDELKKLHQKKYREQFGHFLAEGEHLVLELEKASGIYPALSHSRLYVSGAYQDWSSTLSLQQLTERQMQQISDTPSPQGIVACVPVDALPAVRSGSGRRAVYLHEVQDPGNLGTILRTLAWFGGFDCLLSPGCVDPLNPKVVRASMGAVFHVPVAVNVGAEDLLSRYQHFACLDMQGEPLRDSSFQQAQCLVFGNEARGVPAQLVQQTGARRYTIAGSNVIESLNLASVLGMCLYELNR